jgi:hypothetical protein
VGAGYNFDFKYAYRHFLRDSKANYFLEAYDHHFLRDSKGNHFLEVSILVNFMVSCMH